MTKITKAGRTDRVKSFAELHHILRDRYLHDHHWRFRGQGDLAWPLVPKVGRAEFAISNEADVFGALKGRAIEHLPVAPRDDWAWLAIAQHHGFATRLMDWSFHVLTAAFFAAAVPGNEDIDVAIYAYHVTHTIKGPELEYSPLDFKDVAFYEPMAFVPRIGRQAGVFTSHGDPRRPLDEYLEEHGMLHELHQIIIDKSYRRELLFELSQFGVNWATLFPDLDGLAKHLNWVTSNLSDLDPTMAGS